MAAHAAGPWDVDRVPTGDGVVYAVVRRREPARDGGGARLAFVRRQEALLAAAALSALAVSDRLSLNADKRSGRRIRRLRARLHPTGIVAGPSGIFDRLPEGGTPWPMITSSSPS